LSYLPILCIRVHTCLHVVGHERADKQSGDGGWARSSDGTVIKDRRDGRAIQRSFETGSITEVLRRRTVVDVLRRAVGTPSQLERGELSVSLEATCCTESLFHQCSERNERVPVLSASGRRPRRGLFTRVVGRFPPLGPALCCPAEIP
jgi:hypothetical protein